MPNGLVDAGYWRRRDPGPTIQTDRTAVCARGYSGSRRRERKRKRKRKERDSVLNPPPSFLFAFREDHPAAKTLAFNRAALFASGSVSS
jgi:hypothetical protein